MADVLLDTSAWIDFFRDGTSAVADCVDALLAEDRAALCGMVELELLRGLRPHERKRVQGLLRALPYLETERRDFVAAGERLCELRRQGVTIPAADCIIGMLCLRHGLSLLTLDRHFEHLPDVRRLEP